MDGSSGSLSVIQLNQSRITFHIIAKIWKDFFLSILLNFLLVFLRFHFTQLSSVAASEQAALFCVRFLHPVKTGHKGKLSVNHLVVC